MAMAQPLQQLSLNTAWELAQKNYPAVRQKELVRQTAGISVDNLQKGFLPQFSISGQATYQSDVTSVPISVPGFSIEAPNKDQYKLVADVNQLIYDGGLTRELKTLQQLNAKVEDQKVEVELYKVKDRINQLFLSILYLDEQLKQVELVKKDIETGIKKVEAQVQNGVAFKSNLNMLKAELLKTGQRTIEISTSRIGLVAALALWKLERPELQRSAAGDDRPTFRRARPWFDAVGREVAAVRERLADVKCPRSVDFREELPRHPTGKLYKRLLKDEYWADAGRTI